MAGRLGGLLCYFREIPPPLPTQFRNIAEWDFLIGLHKK